MLCRLVSSVVVCCFVLVVAASFLVQSLECPVVRQKQLAKSGLKAIGVVQINVSVIRGIYTLGHAQTGSDCDGSVKGALPPPRDNTWV